MPREVDPEAYGMDCQPGPSTYPAEDMAEIMPDHVREAIEARKAARGGKKAEKAAA